MSQILWRRCAAPDVGSTGTRPQTGSARCALRYVNFSSTSELYVDYTINFSLDNEKKQYRLETMRRKLMRFTKLIEGGLRPQFGLS